MTTPPAADDVFTLGIAAEDGITNDGRRWWYIGAQTWTSLHAYAAPNGRAAVALFRRNIIDAEVAKGWSRREAADYVRVAGLHIAAGPLTTEQVYECEVGWAWAWAACEFTTLVPMTPATQAEVWPHVSAEDAARIRNHVRDLFRSERKCRH